MFDTFNKGWFLGLVFMMVTQYLQEALSPSPASFAGLVVIALVFVLGGRKWAGVL